MSAAPFDDATDRAPWPVPPADKNVHPIFAGILQSIEAQPAMLARAAARSAPRRFAAEPVTPSAFGALPDAEDRHFAFLEQRAEQIAARVGGDTLAAKNIEIGQLRSELRDARHTLARLEGRAFAPQAGCEFCTVRLCDIEVLAEYDTEERTVLQVLVNGAWIDPEDFFGRSLIDGWNETLQQEKA